MDPIILDYTDLEVTNEVITNIGPASVRPVLYFFKCDASEFMSCSILYYLGLNASFSPYKKKPTSSLRRTTDSPSFFMVKLYLNCSFSSDLMSSVLRQM